MEVFEFYEKENKKIKKSTVNWRIYELVQKGILNRIGRGRYSFEKMSKFSPLISPKEKQLYRIVQKKFPYLDFCIWSTSIIKEFLQHQTVNHFLVIEVERESIDSVFYTIKEQFKDTYKSPDKEIMENYILEKTGSIVLKPLISEAPIIFQKGIPTISLEKLLVDLFCDKKTFYFYQGYELQYIFSNAIERYLINEGKLLRYANRRGKKKDLQTFLQSIKTQNLNE